MHYKQMSELYSAIRRFVEDSGYFDIGVKRIDAELEQTDFLRDL